MFSVDISISVWVLLFNSFSVSIPILKRNIELDFFEVFFVVEEVVWSTAVRNKEA